MIRRLFVAAVILACTGLVQAADTVPTDAQMPGTQPNEVKAPSSGRCDNCHGGYDAAAEPQHTWRGSMMSHAGRDPVFWATLAIAEQDFDGSGDICIRCHMPGAWLDGRSTPTDGSALTDADAAAGVECDLCHRLVNPDGSEHPGSQTVPFVASTNGEGHYGSGQYVLYDGSDKLGPYSDAEARHGFLKSNYHRDPKLCGTCHDVSNPVVGNLAHNFGAQGAADDPVTADGTLGGLVDGKAAFNNPPYEYGVVERTFSEHQASWFAGGRVDSYASLPADLQAGSIKLAYDAAIAGNGNANYEDGDTRFYSCQSCHMRPAANAQGCNKNPRPRPDMPVHDLTGGNYWVPEAIKYMDDLGTLRLGGGISAEERVAMDDGILRALNNLTNAASLSVTNNLVRVTNLTGHKLISGYPEGRRMWLNVKWYDSNSNLLGQDGEYGTLPLAYDIDGDGTNDSVETLLDPLDPNTRVYDAHGAITQEWASQLVAVDPAKATIPVQFDRVTGTLVATLGDVAAGAAGTYRESFHFVLNNKLVKDNRIPPYQMSYDEARKRNILPVPAGQYGSPSTGGVYNHYDDFTLNPPTGAVYATVELMYQPTSWEYIQFLALANNGGNAFLAEEGSNLLAAWRATGMAAPQVMASTTWGSPPTGGNNAPTAADDSYSTAQDTQLVVAAPGVLGNDSDADGDTLTALLDTGTTNGSLVLNTDGSFNYTPNQGFTGTDGFTYHANDGTADSNTATVTIEVTAATGNTAPVANDDAYSTDQDTALSVSAPGVLGNDTDADGDPLSVADPRTDASTSQNGTVTLSADGSFSYTPVLGFTGDDTFSYTATDGTDTSNAATVTVSVIGATDCSVYTDKSSCNGDQACRWDNRNNMCIAK